MISWKVFLWFPFYLVKIQQNRLEFEQKKEQKDNDNNLELRLNLAQIKVGEAPLNLE